ncbi:glycosyltransferase family 4 protein [uncultured Marivita sp.]|uniref:glycosyltransferase family 4 protein n=1 Tax=uncultured Marivita sp. TaxID=888080 RepID=UPI0026130DBB|nr:glycosyltransferase family 4 protein [uncultured Marivita sp.]
MTHCPAAFAIPGDLDTITGGYIYEKHLLEGLRAEGHDVHYIRLGASYPDPTPTDLTHAIDALCAVNPERVLILDGFVSGATETEGLAQVRALMVAMVHHPLALESGLSDARKAHLYKTERDNLALMEHVLVPSPHTAALLTEQYNVAPERITIARPGTRRPLGQSKRIDPPLILSVGLLHPRKGHDVLLQALARIKGQEWKAVIVGAPHDPDHARALADLRNTLGLQDRVHFAGRIPQDELDALYRQASIFALATRFEGYGIVFDEALACGLPIVTCRTGAVPDTVPPEAGRLVPPGEAEPFAAALSDLLTDDITRTRMAAASQRAADRLATWADTARIASAVLNDIAKRRTSG